jgi:hypothetical protein
VRRVRVPGRWPGASALALAVADIALR